MSISETDKIVAAILASAKATAGGATNAEDYIAEYQSFLYHFEMQGQIEKEQREHQQLNPANRRELD
jgi:hypothetical protein